MKNEIKGIVEIQLQLLKEMLQQNKMQFEFTPEAIDALANEGFDPQFGARPLKRVIQKEIVNELSKRILANDINRDEPIKLDYINNAFVFFNAKSESNKKSKSKAALN